MNRRTKIVLFTSTLIFIFTILVSGIISKINNLDDYSKIQGIPEANIKSVNGLDLPITNTSHTQIFIEGNQMFTAAGVPLHLAGFVQSGTQYSVSAAAPNTRHTMEEMWTIADSEGANLVIIMLNSELWENNPDQALYRTYIDTWVNWTHDHNLFYQFKLQSVGDGPNPTKFSHAGTNYKITLPANEAYKTRAMNMWNDLATLYGADRNLVGYSLLNEPYSGSDFSHWDNVMKYYEQAIGNITAIQSNAVFYVMEPYLWGQFLTNFRSRGYVDDGNPNVVYEFHIYYNKKIGYAPWATFYSIGNNAEGDAEIRDYHLDEIMTASDDGHPVFCGEFGIYGADSDDPGREPAPNYERAHQGQQQDMNDLGIHYSMFYMRALDGNAYTCAVYNGTLLSEKGQIWVDNLPAGLQKPP